MIFGPIRQEFQCRPVSRTPSSALPSRCFLLFISLVHASAQDQKGWRELFDREAFRRVRTVCVDTSYLEKGEAQEVKKFVAMESRPGHLLKRLPWELTDQCAAADAVIRLYFAQNTVQKTELIPCSDLSVCGGGITSSYFQQVTKVVLLIYDRASIRILYRTEGREMGTGLKALKVPFSKLVKDLKSAQLQAALPAPPGR